jgi:hypothetical protein
MRFSLIAAVAMVVFACTGVASAVMALAGVLWLWGSRYLHADTLAATAGTADHASAIRSH